MEFTNRVSEFPEKKRIIKVDENNVPIPGEEPILVNIEKAEGAIYTDGTPITAANLNKGNWRDDESLSFKQMTDDIIPPAKTDETQIVTKANGETWLIPPSGLGEKKNLSEPPGTKVKVNNIEQTEISFVSDPQTQIGEKISSSDIVQSSGQNVNKIMSQKAVSNELSGKVNVAQGSGNANKMLGTDGSGNVITVAPSVGVVQTTGNITNSASGSTATCRWIKTGIFVVVNVNVTAWSSNNPTFNFPWTVSRTMGYTGSPFSATLTNTSVVVNRALASQTSGFLTVFLETSA